MAPVLTVIGVGGMGECIARRLGSGRPLLIADHDADRVDRLSATLRRQGYDVTARVVDVSDRDQVDALAAAAAHLGEVTSVVHTAGVSPALAAPERIIAVDLVGTAHVLDAFGEVIAPGGAGVVIASVAGHIFADAVSPEQATALASLPAAELPDLPLFTFDSMPDDLASAMAYGYCKRGNHFRVQAAAPAWGDRGARINSVSPGVTATEMGWTEFEADFVHDSYEAMIAQSAAGRFATAEDVAAAVEFLLDPGRSGFITGTDLLVDGGVVAGVRHGRIQLVPES